MSRMLAPGAFMDHANIHLVPDCPKCHFLHEGAECPPPMKPKKLSRRQKQARAEAEREAQFQNSGLMGGLIGEDDNGNED